MIRLLLALASLPAVASHGWMTSPVSRLQMAYKSFSTGMPDDILRWSPQSCNGPNSCGAWGLNYTESKDKWLNFYGVAGVNVPVWAPGSDIEMQIDITADHGGQSWVMMSCADTITEDGPWTYLERAADDRDHHYLPSSPHIYAWTKGELVGKYNSILNAKWTVPSNFSCSGGRGVGRWLWKTGNTCNDNLNVNTKRTEPFVWAEFKELNDAEGKTTTPTCQGGGFSNEYFISCFDFSSGSAPTPGPAPIPPENAKCCYSKWGALDACGKYPSDAHEGRCNTNWAIQCGQDVECTTVPPPAPPPPTPPPAPVPPSPTPVPPSPTPVPPTPTPTPTPPPDSPSVAMCCWSGWGDKDSCGSYPSGASGSRCNTDWTKTCQSVDDCPTPSPAPPPPTPAPTPPPAPVPTPTPVPPAPTPTPVPPAPTPTPVPPAPTPTPVPPPSPAPAPPAPTPTPTPLPDPPSQAKCCWSHWGDKDSCLYYPSGAGGARCNTEPTKACQSDGDCPTPAPPSPTPPPPTPTPPSPTPPSPTPSPSPIAPDGDVEGCHQAAMAFCDNHDRCHACQGYGTWGEMFFISMCNDGTVACNMMSAKGDVCQCQQKGGCTAHGATCPGPSAGGFFV